MLGSRFARSWRGFAVLCFVGAGLVGCGSGEPPAGPRSDSDSQGGAQASTPQGRDELIADQCALAGCHGGDRPAASLELTGSDPLSQLIGVESGTCEGWLLVVPGQPDMSLLIKKLEGDVPPDCGDPMPPTGSALPRAEVDALRAWIASLAADAAVSSPPSCETCGSGACVDQTADAKHCGACAKECPVGATCTGGACQCPAGLAECDGQCVDLLRDVNHCGSCSESCGAGGTCSSGACSCAAGLAQCPGSCAELSSDAANCGQCGKTCGAGKFCTPTGCGTTADCIGLTKCGGSCVDTNTSFYHCGQCGSACAGGESCVNGSCACPNGEKACNGSCIDTSTDAANCGACGVVCPSGTTCRAGACACPGGGSACGGECVDLQSDTEHCGACGNPCAPGQACVAGQCSCSDRSVDFTRDVAPVLDANCTNAGCHAGTRPKEALDLRAAQSYAELVNVKALQCNDGRLLVKPGEPIKSYLVQKLQGVQMCSGTQMPKAGTSLTAADLEAITAWICQGAQM